jgi:hypothetical protein
MRELAALVTFHLSKTIFYKLLGFRFLKFHTNT